MGNGLASVPKGGAMSGRVLAGAVLLVAAAAACGMLVLQHLAKFDLPGCGFGGGCAKVAKSVWGKVPGIGWPVSFVGGAYFAGMAVAWLATRGNLGVVTAWAARIGAAVSLLYLGIMAGEQAFCIYCAAAHACNLLFVTGCLMTLPKVERPGIAAVSSPVRGMAALAGCFVLVSAVLGVAEQGTSARAKAKATKELDESTQSIIMQSALPGGTTGAGGMTGSTASAGGVGATAGTGAPQTAAQAGSSQQQPAQPVSARPRVFTGRHRMGPEQAAIRVVMFFGYQCSDCKLLEVQAQELLKRYPQMSLSFKHFPLCPACNPYMPQNLHPNACWAARAAETAAMLAGQDGFQRMHTWLFARGGGFTDAELDAALPGLGFEPTRFKGVMQSPETLLPVKADVEEAMVYGLRQTPMVFINGVELKGWQATPNALTKAVESLALASPPVKGPEDDRPPSASDKNVADWRGMPNMAWRSRDKPWAIGPTDAPAVVQIFGDLQDEGTLQADRMVRDAIVGRTDVRYEFRYYPVDQGCNANVARTVYPRGCRAARAAEAAGLLGGDDAYWRVVDWLAANRAGFTDEALRAAAGSLGLDGAALLATMDTPAAGEPTAFDVDIGRRLVIPEVPRLFVNGRVVNGWRIPGAFVFERVLEEAVIPKPKNPTALPNINPGSGR
ncbi:MAG: DsbA family protein [Phycisphaerales bacterium]